MCSGLAALDVGEGCSVRAPASVTLEASSPAAVAAAVAQLGGQAHGVQAVLGACTDAGGPLDVALVLAGSRAATGSGPPRVHMAHMPM